MSAPCRCCHEPVLPTSPSLRYCIWCFNECTNEGCTKSFLTRFGEGPSSLASETPIDGPSHPKDGTA